MRDDPVTPLPADPASSCPAPAATARPAQALPALRVELELIDGPPDLDGRATLQVFDPVRNAHFRLVHPASIALRHWQAGDADAFSEALTAASGLVLSRREIGDIAEFLVACELTEGDRDRSWQGLVERQAAARPALPTRLAHGYLFFRVPLFNPDRVLSTLAPRLGFVLTRGFAVGYGMLLALALFLVMRQWDRFAADIAAGIGFAQLPVYAVMLLALKAVHEAGHALMARHHGARVPSMGVALMLGVPVLYTDTTDIWRLPSRGQRLSVVLAGVGAEMLVAGVALLAWSFLPEGPTRQMAAALATLSIATSLLINLNPCMRFDGYFALSDALDVPNLQDRAFALTRAHMRHVLLGLPRETADDLGPARARLLVVYGYVTWVYRAALYVGIALMIYMVSFKALGLVLLAFELGWFLARPFWSEMRLWWSLRASLAGRRRARLSAAVVLAGLVLAALPLHRVVEAPAIRVAREEAVVHARAAARVAQVLVRDGAGVSAGQLLARLEAPALTARRERAAAEVAALEVRLARAPAVAAERDAALVLARQLETARERLAGLARLEADLEIRAPMSGIVVDLEPGLDAGVWINEGQELGRVVGASGVSVRALVDEAEVRRLRVGATAVFVPETGLGAATPLALETIAARNEQRLGEAALADIHGGPVATGSAGEGLQPRGSLFAVTLASGAPSPLLMERGVVRIAAAAESPAGRLARRVAQVLARESGF